MKSRYMDTGVLICITFISLFPVTFGDRRFCGSGLADALKLLCNGKYCSKSGLGTGLLIQKRSRRKRGLWDSDGIVEECCERPCSISTLIKYCAEPPNQPFLSLLASRPQTANTQNKTNSSAVSPTIPPTLSGSPEGILPLFSRFQSAFRGNEPFDLSPLSEEPPDHGLTMPFRQKRLAKEYHRRKRKML